MELPFPSPWGEGGTCCQGWAGWSGFSGYFGRQGLLVSPGQLRGGEGAGPVGSPRGAGLRLLGPNSPMPTVTTVNPRGPQTSIFHLTVPLGPPGSEVPLSPAQLHRGYPGPQLPTQNQGCPGHRPPPGSVVAPGQPGGVPGHPPAVSPGHLSPSAGCPPGPVPRREPLTGLPCHRRGPWTQRGLKKSLLSQGFAPGSGPPGPHPRALSTRVLPTHPGPAGLTHSPSSTLALGWWPV